MVLLSSRYLSQPNGMSSIFYIFTLFYGIYDSIHNSRLDHFIHTICEQSECFVGDCCQLSRHIICCNFQNWVLPNNCMLLNLLIRKCQLCQAKKNWLYLNNFMLYFTCLSHVFLLQYTRRSAAEVAAEKTFNKLTIKGKKLSIRWGKSQGKQDAIQASGSGIAVPQVPGLPGKHKSIFKSICIK